MAIVVGGWSLSRPYYSAFCGVHLSTVYKCVCVSVSVCMCDGKAWQGRLSFLANDWLSDEANQSLHILRVCVSEHQRLLVLHVLRVYMEAWKLGGTPIAADLPGGLQMLVVSNCALYLWTVLVRACACACIHAPTHVTCTQRDVFLVARQWCVAGGKATAVLSPSAPVMLPSWVTAAFTSKALLTTSVVALMWAQAWQGEGREAANLTISINASVVGGLGDQFNPPLAESCSSWQSTHELMIHVNLRVHVRTLYVYTVLVVKY